MNYLDIMEQITILTEIIKDQEDRIRKLESSKEVMPDIHIASLNTSKECLEASVNNIKKEFSLRLGRVDIDKFTYVIEEQKEPYTYGCDDYISITIDKEVEEIIIDSSKQLKEAFQNILATGNKQEGVLDVNIKKVVTAFRKIVAKIKRDNKKDFNWNTFPNITGYKYFLVNTGTKIIIANDNNRMVSKSAIPISYNEVLSIGSIAIHQADKKELFHSYSKYISNRYSKLRDEWINI